MREHCQLKTCSNFTSNHDLGGLWCSNECFIEFETRERITRRELLEMKVKYDWDLDESEKLEIKEMNIVKSEDRLRND